MSNRRIGWCFFLTSFLVAGDLQAGGEKLYGVHWWDYSRPTVGAGPTGGWSVETVLTHSEAWWQGWWFEPLYQQLTSNHGAEIVTRIDYNWGQTVPAPTTLGAQTWANQIVSDVIGPLGNHSHRWIIGNEPNIVGEGNGWASNQVTPSGYAQIYHTVRQAIKAIRPNDEVLFAPVSPGGVIAGVRWKAGNQWLAEAIDATLALPGGAIDGFAIHSYGNPFAGAVPSVTEFHNTFVSQLAVIDTRFLHDATVYITEWNRSTATTGNLAANEQVSADFLRLALLDVDAWNRRPGNHNIRSLAWFIHDKDYGDAWNQYSLEWWQAQGNPVGHAGDLWTAMLNSSHLPAGMAGTRPSADYNSDGVVDTDDLAAWITNFGRADWVYADGNRNGHVDAADYVMWRKTTTAAGAGSRGQTAPELSTAWQLTICALLATAIGRIKRGRAVVGLLLIGVTSLSGCYGKTGRVEMASIDPSHAAEQAIELYDKDGDSQLSDAELRAVPGILKWKTHYDADHDNFVTKGEIEQRLEKWEADRLGYRSMTASVQLDGRPLANVRVELTPEPYLGTNIKAATGVTNDRGYATLSVAPDDMPEALKRRGIRVGGVYPGTYKITVSHPQKKLPQADGAANPLGDEVARDTVDSSIKITLSSARR